MTGLRFLLRVTLRRLDLAAEIYHLRELQKIPQVISPDEARRLLAVADSLRTRVLLSLAYGCGLRASEVIWLKVKHIDSAQKIIGIEQGKGRKDRNVMLSPKPLDLLRQWWRERPSRHDAGTPLEERWLYDHHRDLRARLSAQDRRRSETTSHDPVAVDRRSHLHHSQALDRQRPRSRQAPIFVRLHAASLAAQHAAGPPMAVLTGTTIAPPPSIQTHQACRRDQIPIALAAPPSHAPPRFRALAIFFGRRPHQPSLTRQRRRPKTCTHTDAAT